MAAKKKPKIEPGLIGPQRLLLVQILLLIAAALSSHLLWISLSHGTAAGCGPESGCDKVLNSPWAYWLNIPVSALSLATYIALLAAAFSLHRAKPAPTPHPAWYILIPGASLVLLAALWFVAIQAVVIKSFCPVCLATHTAGFIAATLLLLSAPLRTPATSNPKKQKPASLPPRHTAALLAASLLALLSLVAGQTLAPRQSFILEVYNGKFQIDIHQVPTIGKPTAPHRLLSLFDYTCHYCRILHTQLQQVHQTFKDQLCIVSLPMPLDKRCNHLVKQDHPDHVQACDYARLGLAVWRANQDRHHEFEQWIFAPEKIPSLAAATTHAQQLVGQTALTQALNDPWISQQISNDVAIYASSPQGNMPQMIIGTNITYGTPGLDRIYQIIEEQLGLARPPQG